MKKLLAILVLGSFVACNSGESETTTDTTTNTVVTPAPVDTTTFTPADTTTGTMVDTTGSLNN